MGRPIKGLAVRAERQASLRGSAVSARAVAAERGEDRGTAAADWHAKNHAVAVCAAPMGRPVKGLAVCAECQAAPEAFRRYYRAVPLNEARTCGTAAACRRR